MLSVELQFLRTAGRRYRWMGSAAMDKVGNIAIGYDNSDANRHPSVAVTGRFASDTLGTMQSGSSIQSGGGSQTNLSRWGDYSHVSVDPADDCTFWYTNE